jgi:hypothetical protein
MYVLAALISVMGVDFLIGRPRTMRHDRVTAGAFATQMAGTAFVAGIVITAFYAAGGTLQLFKTIAYACGAVLLGLFFIVLFLRWFLRWVLRRFYDYDPYDPSS